MLMTQYTTSPAGADSVNLQPTFRRTPLQPKNASLANVVAPKKEPIQVSLFGKDDSNKENRPPVLSLTDVTPPRKIESLELDSSLAEELSAIRKKLERLRLDKERTEKMLEERDAMLQAQTKEIHLRGQAQRQLEIEVDRLYRLNELKSYCLRISPIRSLRAKEHDKVKPSRHHHEVKDEEESIGENVLQSPKSEEVSSKISRKPVDPES